MGNVAPNHRLTIIQNEFHVRFLIDFNLKMNAFTEEQWEKELDNELQEFELVDNGASDANQTDDWEKDADNLLGDEDDEEDLK